jgi:HSP20 family molecular chaperone IbpA
MNLAPDGLPYWSPKTSKFVSDSGDLVIKVELSQIGPEDLEITAEGNRLRITGVRRDPELSNARECLLDEISTGHFECIVESPCEFDLSKAKACFLNGLLRIDVPRKPPRPTF